MLCCFCCDDSLHDGRLGKTVVARWAAAPVRCIARVRPVSCASICLRWPMPAGEAWLPRLTSSSITV